MNIFSIDSLEDQYADQCSADFQAWLEEELAFEGLTPEQIEDLLDSPDFDEAKYRDWYQEYLYENGE